MDANGDRVKSNSINHDSKSLDSPNSVVNGESDGDDESQSLLPSKRGGIMSKNSEKRNKRVQWLDKNGHKLAEILEFQPSDASDSDDDELDSCICRIM